MTNDIKKIIALAANYSISHDITNQDTLARLTYIIIKETAKAIGNRVVNLCNDEAKPVCHDMDIYKGQEPNKLID